MAPGAGGGGAVAACFMHPASTKTAEAIQAHGEKRNICFERARRSGIIGSLSYLQVKQRRKIVSQYEVFL
jgi:hypothetical protein